MDPGAIIDDRFVVEGKVGEGGMGVVYRARDRRTNEVVALKELRSGSRDATERFQREAETLSVLRHPGIVRYVAHGVTSEGERWLAMEWLEGEDVAVRLARRGLTLDETLRLLKGAADALATAHARGVLHRDVKPSNLFLVDGDVDRVKVLDFGVARHSGATSRRGATVTGVVLGTPGYMAPEQARGDTSIDASADVFALGCVAFECMTGQPAFAGAHVMAILAKILLEEAPRVRELRHDVPEPVDALIARMLAKDRTRRPRDGAAVLSELAALASVAPAGRTAVSLRPSAITTGEQQLVSIVAAASSSTATAGPDDATLPRRDLGIDLEPMRLALAPLGGHVDVLLDGTVLASVRASGTALDRAAQAARCALALRRHLPLARMALVTGRAVVGERLPLGESLERAAQLLRVASSDSIRVDEVTAGLLDSRFEVSGDAAGLKLSGERSAEGDSRTLLGRSAECVGRERELALLESKFEACTESEAQIALVLGTVGVGKTRLQQELLARLRARGTPVEIWIGRADPIAGRSPYHLIADALRHATGVRDGEPIELQRSRVLARVARHVRGSERTRITAFVGELMGVPFPEEMHPQIRAARQHPALLADQVQRAFEELVAAECANQPLVIVLEDLHWGDSPTVELLDRLLRNLGDQPILLLALARPEVKETYPRLWNVGSRLELELRGLSRMAAERLVRSVLPTLDEARTSRLVDRAEGNAFYLEELVRAAAAGKDQEVPDSVIAVVQSRLDSLPSDARRALRAASTFGETFWSGGLKALLGSSESDESERLVAELVDSEVIVARPTARFPGESELVFRHALVREAAYAMLTDQDRVLAHRLAATWLLESGERDAFVLADHLDRGGDRASAVGWYLRAAEQAREGYDLLSTIARAELAVRCGAQGEALGRARLLQCQAHCWRAETDLARQRGLEAVALLPEESEGWCLVIGELAYTSAVTGVDTGVAELGRKLASFDPSSEALSAWVLALARTSQALQIAGQHALALRFIERLNDVARRFEHQREPLLLAWILRAQAMLEQYAGPAYLSLALAARDAFERAGDRRWVATQNSDAGEAYRDLGMLAEAEAAYRRTIASARHMGLATVELIASANLGLLVAQQGSLDEGASILEHVLERKESLGLRVEGYTRSSYARVLCMRNQLDEAREQAVLAIDQLQAMQLLQPLAYAVLSKVELAAGRTQEALTAARAANEPLERFGQVEEGENFVRLALAEALLACGDRASATATIALARERLMARAATIDDAAMRTTFLENVADHARTLALARELAP